MEPDRLKLFDDIDRDFMGPKCYSDPCFDYLNRSGRTIAHRIRSLLERWFEEFPENGKKELWRRFRSSDDQEHLSAFFELYCYALIQAHNYSAEYQPLAGTKGSARPDFLVLKHDNLLFYMECTLAADPSLNRGEKARLNRLIDELNKVDSPNFFIEISVEAIGKGSAPSSKIRKFLERELPKFNSEDVTEQERRHGWRAWPCLLWQGDGWKLEFYLRSKPRKVRDKTDLRPVGGRTINLRRIDSRKRLSNALKDKATRYGRLDLPFIIAVDSLDITLEDDDIMQVLFGTLQYHVNLTTGAHWASRLSDGFWYGPKGPRNRRVSGVLIVANLTPWTIAERSVVLWHNPFATNPLDPEIWEGPQMILKPETSRMELRERQSISRLLGLSQDWPRESG